MIDGEGDGDGDGAIDGVSLEGCLRTWSQHISTSWCT